MDTTCFEIKTVYSREDLEGLYDAFLSGEKSVRISKKITKAASTFGAILFWAFAALTLISNLFTGSLYIFLIAFSMSAVIALLGWLIAEREEIVFVYGKGKRKPEIQKQSRLERISQ